MKQVNLTFAFLISALAFIFQFETVAAQIPVVSWAKSFSDTTKWQTSPRSIAVDASGNVYTTGLFYSTVDFDPGSGVFNLSSDTANNGIPSENIFIQKLDAAGNFVWAKNIGNKYEEIGMSMAIDVTGNIYIVGNFTDTVDFDPGPGVINLGNPNNGNLQAFILKLDDSGNFVWVKGLFNSSFGYSQARSIALDASGNILVTGFFTNTVDFDPGPGTFNLATNGSQNSYLLKLDASANFVWAKLITGDDVQAFSITADLTGNVYSTGRFNGATDFDPGAGNFMIGESGMGGGWGSYVLKLNDVGDFQWATEIGYDSTGVTQGIGLAIVADAAGNIYSEGGFTGTVDADPGPGITNLLGPQGVYIQKLNPGGGLIWANSFDAIGFIYTCSLTLDATNNVYTTGLFNNIVDFDPGTGVFNLTSGGSNGSSFVQKLNASGNFLWAGVISSAPGANSAVGTDIAVDVAGNVYTTGEFNGIADFDPTASVYNLVDPTNSLGTAAFVCKWQEGFVGIAENTFNSRIEAYPNPTSNSINVNLGDDYSNLIVEITSITGQKLFTQVYPVGHSIHVDLNGDAGMYFISIKDGSGKQANLKVVKQ